jgi:hypothetical protein
MASGLALLVGGLILLARVPVESHYFVDFLPAMIAIGSAAGSRSIRRDRRNVERAPEDAGLVSGS